MRIETAHKILIGSAIAFFLFYALFETSRWWKGGEIVSLAMAGAGAAAAAVFALYQRWYVKSLGR